MESDTSLGNILALVLKVVLDLDQTNSSCTNVVISSVSVIVNIEQTIAFGVVSTIIKTHLIFWKFML